MAAAMHSTTSTTAHVTKDYLPALARLLMCSLFIWDGVLQLRDPAGTVTYFTSLNVPSPQITVWVSIAVGRHRHSRRLYDALGRGVVDLVVPRHRLRCASARRQHGEHDAFLQEFGDGGRPTLRDCVWSGSVRFRQELMSDELQLVIGPATSGRTRWLAMTIQKI